MEDKGRNIQKLSSISPKLSWGCSKQEPWARIWIFSPLGIPSFYLNTVALWVYVSFFLGTLCLCSFLMVHFALTCSRGWENRLSEKWDNCSTESEAGGRRDCSQGQGWATWNQEMCLRFPGAPRSQGPTSMVWKDCGQWYDHLQKTKLCITPPFPPVSMRLFILFYKESNVIYSLTMNHDNQYLFIVLHLQLNYSQHKWSSFNDHLEPKLDGKFLNYNHHWQKKTKCWSIFLAAC